MATQRPTAPDPAAVIAVVGTSSYVGSAIMLHLESEMSQDAADGRRLVSLDNNPLRWPVSRLSAHRMGMAYGGEEITLEAIPDLLRLETVDTVIYVGSNYDGADAAERLAETPQWVAASRAAGVRQFVCLSDYRVYGVKPGHPIPITERAEPDRVGIHRHIAAAEPDCEPPDDATTSDEMRIAVLRTAMTLGPGGASPAADEFLARRIRAGGKHNPPLQFLHEYDLARAVSVTIRGRLAGIYNLAGDGTICVRDAALAGNELSSRPGNWAGLRRCWAGKAGDPTRFPVVISAAKFKQAAGFKYKYSSQRALLSYCSSVLLEPGVR